MAVGTVGVIVSAFVGSATSGSAPPPRSGGGIAALKHAASEYARVTLNGGFAEFEAALSPECRSTDHITAQTLPLAREMWEEFSGFSFHSVRITGVRVRNVTSTNGQAEVTYNLLKAGNDNWVTYALVRGAWKVAGQCATPIGNTRESGPP